jgi:hypothetical protein
MPLTAFFSKAQENETRKKGKQDECGGKAKAPMEESIQRGRGKPMTPTRKSSGSPGESRNETPEKWNKDRGKAKMARRKNADCVFCLFQPSVLGGIPLRAAVVIARKPEQRKQVQGRSEAKRNGERSGP